MRNDLLQWLIMHEKMLYNYILIILHQYVLLWVVVDCCGLLRIVVDCYGLFWIACVFVQIVVDYCALLWLYSGLKQMLIVETMVIT